MEFVKEEVEFLPNSLITAVFNNTETAIEKSSPVTLDLRFSEENNCAEEENGSKNVLKTAFFDFEKYEYDEIEIEKFSLRKKEKNEFYTVLSFSIEDERYTKRYRKLVKDYYEYIKLKVYGDENEFSKVMTGYPSESDYDFYESFEKQEKEWSKAFSVQFFKENKTSEPEIAVKLDNKNLWQQYLEKDSEKFFCDYLKHHYLDNTDFMKFKLKRIYIGSEFCHNLFSKEEIFYKILNKAVKENLEITVCFTYMRDYLIENTENIIENLYKWCRAENKKAEIVINDWGMFKILKGKEDYFTYNYGLLLNKYKKDPRIQYKKGIKENTGLIAENNLNASFFQNYIKKLGIERIEYESCGYEIKMPENKNFSFSMHVPYYLTNLSQYCPLYALAANGDRSRQQLIKKCPQICSEKVIMYGKKLKLTGRYNGLFGFDKNFVKLSNADRIVFNFS